MYWTIPRIWEGQTAHLIGGGPSIKPYILRGLQGKNVIAINAAFKDGNWPLVWFQDEGFFRDNYEDLKAFAGWKVTCDANLHVYSWVKTLRRGIRQGFDLTQDAISRGTHSGYGAINLAAKMGVKRIILYGFDMRRIDGKDNYHDRHKRVIEERVYEENFIPIFKFALEPLKALGIEVLNATPGSALPYFPIIHPMEGLNYE